VRRETDRDLAAAEHAPDGSILVSGTFPIHDLPDLGIELVARADGDYTTIAGLVIAKLGHLPNQPGETVALDDWTAEITAVERRAITGVRLRPVRLSPIPAQTDQAKDTRWARS
jgi:putative hemolysin